jgi:hypothetical protein
MTAIQDKLLAWGKGLAMHTATNGYPKQSPYVREMRSAGNATVKALPLAGEEQERIDIVVSEMKSTKPQHYEVICYCYISRMIDGKIAKRVKKSRTWVRETRVAAEYYLEGRLV